MKKILIILFLIFNTSLAGNNSKEIKFEAKLIDTIAKSLFKKDFIFVYFYGKEAEKINEYSKILIKVEDIRQADFVLASEKLNSESKFKDTEKPIIGMKYFLLKDENVIGAIFWHKGRPNIVFIRYRLKKFKLNPPKSLEKYIEDKVW